MGYSTVLGMRGMNSNLVALVCQGTRASTVIRQFSIHFCHLIVLFLESFDELVAEWSAAATANARAQKEHATQDKSVSFQGRSATNDEKSLCEDPYCLLAESWKCG